MQPVEATRRQKLSILIKEAGSQANLSEIIGKAPAQISQWLNASINSKTGKPRVMSNATARELEILTKKPQGWMDQPLTSEEVSGDEKPNTSPAEPEVQRIPLISYIQAGRWRETCNAFPPGDAEEWLYSDRKHSKETFALTLKGNSMEPDFKEGDRVVIDPAVSPKPGSYVAARNGGEGATFKKYRLRSVDLLGNEIFELVPLNDDYPIMRSDETSITIIGTMVEHRRYFR